MRERTIGATLIALVLTPHLLLAQADSRPAQDAAQPNTLFPSWRLQGIHSIDPRVAPNAGFRLRPLFPTFSPVAPDFHGAS